MAANGQAGPVERSWEGALQGNMQTVALAWTRQCQHVSTHLGCAVALHPDAVTVEHTARRLVMEPQDQQEGH